MNDLKQLEPDQLEYFNNENVIGRQWDVLFGLIESRFPGKTFTFLDIGGGNGLFTDRILDRYPRSRAILLDNATNLIKINKPHPRKTIVTDSAANLEKYLRAETVDLVFINWVLHHLVSASWRRTRENVTGLFETIRRDSNVKALCIFENAYNGILFDDLPGRLIFTATSLRSVRSLVRRMGANTAGVGVAFRSKKAWLKTVRRIFGTSSVAVTDFEIWTTPLLHRIFLHIGTVHESLFWIKTDR